MSSSLLAFEAWLAPHLEAYELSLEKLGWMVLGLIGIYTLRTIGLFLLERLFLSVDSIKKFSKEIVGALKSSIELITVIVSLNAILYIYHDFESYPSFSHIFNILYTLIITFIIFKFVNAVAKMKLSEVVDTKAKMKNDLINIGIKILYSFIFLVGFLVVLYFAGVNLTAVLSGLGIGGIAVAFAAKDSISNFFGTLSVLVSDVFSQGDWIEVNAKEGVVVEIGLRVTTLRTFDNALIAIPNGTFASADVKNWSKRTLGRRIRMSVGVKYGSNAADLKNAVAEIYTMLDKHKGIATQNTLHQHQNATMTKLVSKDDLEGVKKNLLVALDEFAPSSINILIYCFSKSVVWEDWMHTKEDIMYKIMEILEKNRLEFALPSLSLYEEKTRVKDNEAL